MADTLKIIVNSDEIRKYFNDVKKLPVMSRQREGEIFKLLNDVNISESEKRKVRNELINGNLRFVISVAKQYQNNGIDLLDLISEGNIGLIKAIEKFDINSGNKFISYAVWWVKQTIMASINDNSRVIRIPSNLIQEMQKSKKTSMDENNENKLSYSLPTCIDLSKEIDHDGNHLIDVIANPNAENPEDVLDNGDELKFRIKQLLNVLNEREKIIIEKYYGLNGFEVSLDDLGEELGCTKERVRQIKDTSIKKLRNESYYLMDFLG